MTTRIIFLIFSVSLLAAPLALAGDDQDSRRVVVIGDDGEHTTLTINGNRMKVVASDGSDVTVHEFDFSQLGELINSTVSAAMAGLEDDLSIQLDDEMLQVTHGDQACAVNMEIVAQELRHSLANLHEHLNFNMSNAHAHAQDRDHELSDTEELQAELDRLKAELGNLREELDEIR